MRLYIFTKGTDMKHRILLSFTTAAILITGALSVSAEESLVDGYAKSGGGVAKNSYGECWRTSYANSSEKLLECGYEAPKPEPVKVAAPVPEPKPVVVSKEVVATSTAVSLTTTIAEMVDIKAGVLFGFDSAELSDDGKSIINERIQRFHGKHVKTLEVKVVGYTDTSGPEAYNKKLSERRAETVATYLEQHTKIQDKEIESIGMGEAEPIADNGTREGRKLNRRVEIHFEGTMEK
ncbi:MAG: OmpA family protein [gamma proteobacterium endosymbiont of Lamellibrachia anaximandri]|nr:OmpA family protein [gamma proteobacterium endosymbiont of Lamellibrachia anaximandri]